MEDADEVDIYDETDDETDDDGDFVLTEIEARVVANNTRLHAQMIKANSGQSALFMDGSIITLQIPPKLRLATEPSRLPVRVLEYKNGQYNCNASIVDYQTGIKVENSTLSTLQLVL